MKKYRILGVYVMLSALSSAGMVHAEIEEARGKSLDTIVEEIREYQRVGKGDRIDCNRVTDEQFEALGEAVMDIMHPDPYEHEMMDRMMGGEDSEVLSTMHRMMGMRYLGCYYGGLWEDVMGPGMMGRGMMGGARGWGMTGWRWSPMMGEGAGWFWYGGVLMWVLFIVLIVLVIYLVIRSARAKPARIWVGESPTDILKARYAKGEITKEQFNKMKRDLQG